MNATTPLAGTILSVWAHPDDETYLAGGLMARARDAGQRVVCASATSGEHGTADPATWPPDRLGRIRRWEATAAMSVLGVTEHHILGLPDGGLEQHADAGLAWVGALLDDVQPDVVLTFGDDGITGHPDHVAVHHWVVEAWHARGCNARLLCATPTIDHLARFGAQYEEWGMYMTDDRPTGVPTSALAAHIELSGSFLDRKLTALRAMATQTSDLVTTIGLDLYTAQVAEEAFIELHAELAHAGARAPSAATSRRGD